MRVTWVMCGLSILVSMAVCLIVIGQQKALARLEEQTEELKLKAERLDNGLDDRDYQRGQLEKQLEEDNAAVLELEADLAKKAPEVAKKRAMAEVCRASVTQLKEELAGLQVQNDTKEMESWAVEITSLKQQMEQRSALCDFLKKDSGVQKLCPPKEARAATAVTSKPPTITSNIVHA